MRTHTSKRRWRYLGIPVLLVGLLAACSSPGSDNRSPEEVALAFIADYDAWAQDGYANPIPDALIAATSIDMQNVLKDDINWYQRGGVQQHGSVRIVETKVDVLSEGQAVVTVVLDASGVTVTAEGEDTWVDYSKPIVTRVYLERDETWRVTSTDSGD